MNIWILNHYALAPDAPGLTRHFDFGAELVRRGHRVRILASGFNNLTLTEERLQPRERCRVETVEGVDFVWVRSTRYRRNDWRRVVNMLSYTVRVVPLALRLEEKPDVVLASSPHLFAGLAGWLLARAKGARFVFEVRDLWPEALVQVGGFSKRSPAAFCLRALEKFLYRRASKVITVMSNTADYMGSRGIPPARIVCIPHAVSPALFLQTERKLPGRMEELLSGLKRQGKLLVCYAGLHGVGNDVDSVVGAAGILRDSGADGVHLLLVGDGTEKARLEKEARERGLANVTFCEPVPKLAIPRLLSLVDIVVKPRRRSGLTRYGISPGKTFDYMMSGTPVVWAGSAQPDDPVAAARCGISVSSQSAEEMADAILRLCALSESERREIGLRGREYAMRHHAVPVLASRLLQALGG